MRMCQMMLWLFWKICNGKVKKSNISGIAIDYFSSTGCNTRLFLVLPAVIQEGAGSTQSITDNCPAGAYIERVLGGIFIPLTRFCKTHCVLRIWQILSAQGLETGQREGNF